MPIEINKIDTFQTRVFQSFVNLTSLSSTKFPAVTSARITKYENCTECEPLTSYSIFDQWAVRTISA